MLSSTLLITLDDSLLACLAVCSEVHLQVAFIKAPKSTFKHPPVLTRLHTPSILSSKSPSTLWRRKRLPISLDYMLQCMHLHVQFKHFLNCSQQLLEGMRLAEYSGQCSMCSGWHVAGGRQHLAGGIDWLKSQHWVIR
jgi:hypothetical protein